MSASLTGLFDASATVSVSSNFATLGPTGLTRIMEFSFSAQQPSSAAANIRFFWDSDDTISGDWSDVTDAATVAYTSQTGSDASWISA